MKRKREKIHGQASKKLKATPSSDVFRLKVASKLSALLKASLAELGDKTESLSASSELKEVNRLPVLSGTVKPEPSSAQEDLDPLTKSLLNFIDSAKTRLSELFKKENRDVYAKKFGVSREEVLTCENKTDSEVCIIDQDSSSIDQDSLQAQISEKFQSLFKKALNTNGLSQSVHEVEQTETEVEIIDEEWQNVSLLLDDFLKSARKKVNDLLSTKSNTEGNNKCIPAKPITESVHKKLSYIPNSKCREPGKHLSCDSAVDVTHGIDNYVAGKADLSCSPVLTHTPKKPLKTLKTVSVNSSSSANSLLNTPLVRNKSSNSCVTNRDHDLTVKSSKAANLQCPKVQPISLDNKSALRSSSSTSNPVHSRTLRSCSLIKPKSTESSVTGLKNTVKNLQCAKVQPISLDNKSALRSSSSTSNPVHSRTLRSCSLIKPKSTESSVTGPKNTVKNQFVRKFPARNNSASTSLQQSKRKSSVAKSFNTDKTLVDPSASFKTPNTVAMEFGIPYEANSFDDPSNYEFEGLDYGTGSGILFMDEAEHAPDVLNLEVVIDEGNNSDESSSEPEVLCLGEKVPTYEVVTIEEDEEATHVASAEVIPTSSTGSGNLPEEKSFECPHCGKSYKVESLLKFHIRMHVSSVVQEQSTVEEDAKTPTSQEGRSQERKKTQRTKKLAPDKESSGAEVKVQKKKQTRRHKNRHLS